MAKTLNDLRRRLDELGQQFDPECQQQRDEILTLAFLLYDPDSTKADNLLSTMGVKGSDAAQGAFWSKCKGKIPELSEDAKEELIHAVVMDVLFLKLTSFQSEKGRLTRFLEERICFDVIDRVRRDFGRSTTAPSRQTISLDAPVGAEEESPTLGETLSWEERGYRQVEESGFDVAEACELFASALLFSEDRDRVGVREQRRRHAFRVIYTSGLIHLEHDGQEEPTFRFRNRIEDVLVGDFSNHCLENEPGVALPAIRRSPIRAEHYLPLNGYSDEGRRVGRLKDAAAAGFLGLAKSSYSETREKFRAFLWDELRKKHMTDENTERK